MHLGGVLRVLFSDFFVDAGMGCDFFKDNETVLVSEVLSTSCHWDSEDAFPSERITTLKKEVHVERLAGVLDCQTGDGGIVDLLAFTQTVVEEANPYLGRVPCVLQRTSGRRGAAGDV